MKTCNWACISPKAIVKKLNKYKWGYDSPGVMMLWRRSEYTKWGTISNRNLIWMIGSNVSNEMMLHMQIRMLSIPLVKCENNVYHPKIHFWRLVKLIHTFHVIMLKRYSTILVWCSIGEYSVFVVKWHFSWLEEYNPKWPHKTSREILYVKC